MWQWLRELRDILREPKPCQSCDILKVELANMRREKDMLLSKVLAPQVAEERPIIQKPLPLPRHKPWRVKQQELEQADRAEHARIMQEFKSKIDSAERVMGVDNGIRNGNEAGSASQKA